jgi:hypothetical protein
VVEQKLYSTAGGTAVSTGTNSNVSGERQSWGLMANFLYQADLQWLGLDPLASPYLGVGIGTARLHAVTHSQNTLITDSADTQLAYQGIIGLRYSFSDARGSQLALFRRDGPNLQPRRRHSVSRELRNPECDAGAGLSLPASRCLGGQLKE